MEGVPRALIKERPMATISIPDHLTPEQRLKVCWDMGPEDGVAIALWVERNHPEVFDEAVQHTARADLLALLAMTPEERVEAAQTNARIAAGLARRLQREADVLRSKTTATKEHAR